MDKNQTTYDKCKKKCFSSRKKAKAKMKELNKGNHNIQAIYYCDTCQAFHHTSYSKKKSRRFTRIKNKRKANDI